MPLGNTIHRSIGLYLDLQDRAKKEAQGKRQEENLSRLLSDVVPNAFPQQEVVTGGTGIFSTDGKHSQPGPWIQGMEGNAPEVSKAPDMTQNPNMYQLLVGAGETGDIGKRGEGLLDRFMQVYDRQSALSQSSDVGTRQKELEELRHKNTLEAIKERIRLGGEDRGFKTEKEKMEWALNAELQKIAGRNSTSAQGRSNGTKKKYYKDVGDLGNFVMDQIEEGKMNPTVGRTFIQKKMEGVNQDIESLNQRMKEEYADQDEEDVKDIRNTLADLLEVKYKLQTVDDILELQGFTSVQAKKEGVPSAQDLLGMVSEYRKRKAAMPNDPAVQRAEKMFQQWGMQHLIGGQTGGAPIQPTSGQAPIDATEYFQQIRR